MGPQVHDSLECDLYLAMALENQHCLICILALCTIEHWQIVGMVLRRRLGKTFLR